MDLKEYHAMYGDEEIKRLCEAIGSKMSYFRRLVFGHKSGGKTLHLVPSRCAALHIEKETGGKVSYHDLLKRPTEEEYEVYLRSNRGRYKGKAFPAKDVAKYNQSRE